MKFDKNQVIEKAQWLALANFLSDWPREMSFDQILEVLEDDKLDRADRVDMGIDIWCPFEYHDPSDVAEYIKDLYENIVWKFTETESEGKNAIA